jgi:hypothetical protein
VAVIECRRVQELRPRAVTSGGQSERGFGGALVADLDMANQEDTSVQERHLYGIVRDYVVPEEIVRWRWELEAHVREMYSRLAIRTQDHAFGQRLRYCLCLRVVFPLSSLIQRSWRHIFLSRAPKECC